MPQYIYTVKQGVTSTTLDNEDGFIGICSVPKASTNLMIKRIQVSADTPNDNRIKLRCYIMTSTASGMVSTVAISKDAMARASGASIFVKNGTTTTNTASFTVVATVFEADFNARGVWEWIARDELDYITTLPSTWFTLVELCSSASVTTMTTVEWLD